MSAPRNLIPHEHGAYGQILMPLFTGLLLGRPGAAAFLIALAAFAGFMAYEPALVASGHRGERARAEDGRRARRWVLVLGAACFILGLAGFILAPPVAKLASLFPPGLAAMVGLLVAADLERTALGEVMVAVALSSCGLPVAIAAGAEPSAATAAWLAWVLAFAAAVVAVHVLISRGRPTGPDRGPVAAALAVGIAAAAFGLWAADLVPVAVPVAVTPMTAVSLALALFQVTPRQLKRVGWTFMGASVATLLLLVTGLR
ncbi:MAG TPA: YwiC-like family protein [Anaeromyxobacteraceae bacterium]|nr:YwiC-like family protein [Anaeromyxobacteraceae bacterium]